MFYGPIDFSNLNEALDLFIYVGHRELMGVNFFHLKLIQESLSLT